jgi:hypothetical protein
MTSSTSIVSYDTKNDFNIHHIIRLSDSDIYFSIGSAIFALIPRLIFLKSYQTIFQKNLIEDLSFLKLFSSSSSRNLSKNYPEFLEDVDSYFTLMNLVYHNENSDKKAYDWLGFYINDIAHVKRFNNAIRGILASNADSEKKDLIQNILTDSDPSEDLVNLFTILAEKFRIVVCFFDAKNDRNHKILPKQRGNYPKVFLVKENGYSLGLIKEEIKIINKEKTSAYLKLFYIQNSIAIPKKPSKVDPPDGEEITNTGLEQDLIEIIEKLAYNLSKKRIYLDENREIFNKFSEFYEPSKIPRVQAYLNPEVQLNCECCSEKLPSNSQISQKKNCKCNICESCLNGQINCPKCGNLSL